MADSSLGPLPQVTVFVMDYDFLTKDQCVDFFDVDFDEILRGERPRLKWHHLYGMGRQANATVETPFYDLISKIRNYKSYKEIQAQCPYFIEDKAWPQCKAFVRL